jgi:hypothetical protein
MYSVSLAVKKNKKKQNKRVMGSLVDFCTDVCLPFFCVSVCLSVCLSPILLPHGLPRGHNNKTSHGKSTFQRGGSGSGSDVEEEDSPPPTLHAARQTTNRIRMGSPSDAGWEEEGVGVGVGVGTPSKEPMVLAEAHNGLKSCISAKKKKAETTGNKVDAEVPPESARKNVNFGSPDVREFDHAAPTTEQKPVSRNEAISMGYVYIYISRVKG